MVENACTDVGGPSGLLILEIFLTRRLQKSLFCWNHFRFKKSSFLMYNLISFINIYTNILIWHIFSSRSHLLRNYKISLFFFQSPSSILLFSPVCSPSGHTHSMDFPGQVIFLSSIKKVSWDEVLTHGLSKTVDTLSKKKCGYQAHAHWKNTGRTMMPQHKELVQNKNPTQKQLETNRGETQDELSSKKRKNNQISQRKLERPWKQCHIENDQGLGNVL